MSLQLRWASFVEHRGQYVDGSSAGALAADNASACSRVEIGGAPSKSTHSYGAMVITYSIQAGKQPRHLACSRTYL
jgi:hypothetical protein